MRNSWLRKEIIFYMLAAIAVIFVFRTYFFQHKILFPSNLLVSVYAPWRYEPDPQYPNGPPNKPIGFDNIREFFPNRKILKEAFMHGTVPLWNPYIYSGAPFMASFDTSVWYPLSVAATLLPVQDGWNVLVIIQPVLSLLFMYLFLKSMKLRQSVAGYGAFIYAFSGWMIVYWQEILVLEHSFLWLPLALYASNRIWKNSKDPLAFFLLVFSLASSVFGGFVQMSLYVFLTVLLWNIYCFLDSKDRRTGWTVLLASIVSILVSSIQLLPSIEAFLLSPRGTQDASFIFKDFLLPFVHIITLIAPDFWGNPGTYNYFGGNGFYFEKMIFFGVIPLVFFLYGFLEEKKRKIKFWKILGLGALSLGFALPTSWLPFVLHIPVLSSSYPTRAFSVFVFSAAVLSSFGLQSFLDSPKRKRLAQILACLSIVTVSLVLYAVVFDQRVTLRNLVVPTGFIISGWFIWYVSRFFIKMVFFVTCFLAVVSSFYFAHKYLSFSDKKFIYPHLQVLEKLGSLAQKDRVWGYGNAFIEKNIPQYFGWHSSDGYGNLSSGRYAEFLSTIGNEGKLNTAVRRSDTDMYHMSEWDTFSQNPYRLRVMSFLGVKYVLESKNGENKDKVPTALRFSSDLFTLEWEDQNWKIWRYMHALPRAFIAPNYLVRKDPQEIVRAFYDPTVDLSTTVIIEEDPDLSNEPESQPTRNATIESYKENEVHIKTDAGVAGFLVLSDNYYPGWVGYVDGQKTKIYRTNYSFRSVFVPSGTHSIRFVYEPWSFKIGIVCFGVGIFVTVLFILKKRRQP